MPKRNSSNQTYTNNADGYTLGGGTTERDLTVTGADITITGSGANVHTFPSATCTLLGTNTIVPTGASVYTLPSTTSTLWGDDRIKMVTLSGDYTNATTSMTEVTGFNTTLGTGTYTFKFSLITQSSATTNSFKFAVNHTGTVTTFMYNMFFPSAGVTAATGAVDQETNATTGAVWAYHASRVKNTTLGPQTGVDTADANILIIIEGIMIVTVSGDFELYYGNETTGTGTVKTGSSCVIMKVA